MLRRFVGGLLVIFGLLNFWSIGILSFAGGVLSGEGSLLQVYGIPLLCVGLLIAGIGLFFRHAWPIWLGAISGLGLGYVGYLLASMDEGSFYYLITYPPIVIFVIYLLAWWKEENTTKNQKQSLLGLLVTVLIIALGTYFIGVKQPADVTQKTTQPNPITHHSTGYELNFAMDTQDWRPDNRLVDPNSDFIYDYRWIAPDSQSEVSVTISLSPFEELQDPQSKAVIFAGQNARQRCIELPDYNIGCTYYFQYQDLYYAVGGHHLTPRNQSDRIGGEIISTFELTN